MENSITLIEVLALAERLSPIDKVRLIEWVAPQIERELPDPAILRADNASPAWPGDLSDILADSDRVREQIAQWQRQAAIQPEDSALTLHRIREARDADFDYLR